MTSSSIYSILESKAKNSHCLNRYFKLISHRLANPISKGERHHICPKAKDLFPEFADFETNPWNMVILTKREHTLAHWYLWRIYGGSQAYAFHLMGGRFARRLNRNLIWENASPERREKQAEVMRKVSATKRKPKENREYQCIECGNMFTRLVFAHHERKENPVCGYKCSAARIMKIKKHPTTYKRNKPAWNKGIPNPHAAENGRKSAAKMAASKTGKKRCYKPDGSFTYEYPTVLVTK